MDNVKDSEKIGKSENIALNLKITFISLKKSNILEKYFSVTKKKICYPLSFPILGLRDLTRALQFIPFQNPAGVV